MLMLLFSHKMMGEVFLHKMLYCSTPVFTAKWSFPTTLPSALLELLIPKGVVVTQTAENSVQEGAELRQRSGTRGQLGHGPARRQLEAPHHFRLFFPLACLFVALLLCLFLWVLLFVLFIPSCLLANLTASASAQAAK